MFSLDELARIAGARVIGDGRARPTGFTADSRRVTAGDLFFALPGARSDGHAFLADALDRGACAAVVSEVAGAESRGPLLVAGDVLGALHAMARAWRDRFSIPLVGVTGSNGKTTTKELVAHLAGEAFRVYVAPQNYNTEIGLPLALLAMPHDAQLGVFELGADRPGDIALLVALLRPSVGIVTSVGQSHLEAFGTTAAVAEEKWNLVRGVAPGGTAFANMESPELRALAAREGGASLVSVGLAHGDVRGRVAAAVPRLTVELDLPRLRLAAPLVGRHNATNLLLAALCAMRLGVPAEDVERRASSVHVVRHRMEPRRAEFGLVLDDVYNANPTSMSAALRTLAEFGGPATKKVVVFGDMLGLGDGAGALHAETARLALELPVDRIYPVGELSTSAFAVTGDPRVRVLPRAAIASDVRATLAGETDAVVLVKGSRGMRLEEVADAIVATGGSA